MQIHFKEKALLANQYKIEKAEAGRNFIGRNKIKIILFGIFISIIGPGYTHQPNGINRKKAVNALEFSDFGYLGTVIVFAVFYTLCILIAYWTGLYQDNKKIAKLKKQRIKIQKELEQLRNS